MTYVLEAFVATHEVAAALAARFDAGDVARVGQGLGLVPVTRQFARGAQLPVEDHEEASVDDELDGDGRDEDGDLDDWRYGGWLLSGGSLSLPLLSTVAEVSMLGPVAYVEAFFWGGSGAQASVVWDGGRIVLGPIVENEDDEDSYELADRAINQALRRLGARVEGDVVDEFDTVGLGLHRRTHDWAIEASNPPPPAPKGHILTAVQRLSAESGHAVLAETPQTPGGVFADAAVIRAGVGRLREGDLVEAEVEGPLPFAYGCRYRATAIRPV